MDYLKQLAVKLGAVIDHAVPFAVGARTKIAVVACPLLGFAPAILAAIPGAAPAAVAVPYLQAVFCSTAPLFAFAGLVRDAAKPTAPTAPIS